MNYCHQIKTTTIIIKDIMKRISEHNLYLLYRDHIHISLLIHRAVEFLLMF